MQRCGLGEPGVLQVSPVVFPGLIAAGRGLRCQPLEELPEARGSPSLPAAGATLHPPTAREGPRQAAWLEGSSWIVGSPSSGGCSTRGAAGAADGRWSSAVPQADWKRRPHFGALAGERRDGSMTIRGLLRTATKPPVQYRTAPRSVGDLREVKSRDSRPADPRAAFGGPSSADVAWPAPHDEQQGRVTMRTVRLVSPRVWALGPGPAGHHSANRP